jgi:hypothetical protein
MVFNVTFNNISVISWQSVLLVEETGVLGTQLRRGVFDTTLSDKFVSDLRQVGRWFSPSTPVSSTNKTDCHDITEILLKVTLNTIHDGP